MTNGWRKRKLGDLLQIQNGYAFNSKAFDPTGGTPLIRIRDLKRGTATETRFVGPYDEKYVVNSGDLLIGMDGEFGCYEWQGGPALLNQRVCRLQEFAHDILPRFLFYGVSAYLKGIENVTGFTTVKHLSSKQILDIDFQLPAISEQRRIVGILDEAFAGIATAKANAEKNLQNAREFFESRTNSIFSRCGAGWLQRPLGELCEIKHGFAFQSRFFTADGDYVLLTPGNFFESGGYRDRGEKQKYYQGEIPRGYVLQKGDLLVAMTEQAAGLLGSPILVPESGRFLHNQRLGLVVKKPGVPWTNEFFFHVFSTRRVRKEIHDSASGVKVRHTSPKKIGDVPVSFPDSISEQRRIVANLNALSEYARRLDSIYQCKLDALDELKKSLLHQAFSGQL